MHNPGRNVALALAVASLSSAPIGRWSAPVSVPHSEKERESDLEQLVGQDLWRVESLVKQVGEFASSGKADFHSRGEEPTRVPDAHGRVVARLMTACGGSPETRWHSSMTQNLAHARLSVAWITLISEMSFSVTWLSLSADRIISVFTPNVDHYAGLMVGATAALVERRLRLQRRL